jgi:hypothetical protein
VSTVLKRQGVGSSVNATNLPAPYDEEKAVSDTEEPDTKAVGEFIQDNLE